MRQKFFIMFMLFFLVINLSARKKEAIDNNKVKTSTQTEKKELSNSKLALDTIVKHLKSSDSDIKSYAIIALSKTHNQKLIPVIQKYLNDPNKYVQVSAVKALWELGEVKSISKLYEIINNPPQENPNDPTPLTQIKIISQNKIREKAIETLVDLIGIKANKILLELKENDNFGQIRDIASRELAKIGYSNELKNFYDALNSKDEELRNQAAESLVRICPEEGSKIIEAFKKEKSIRVKMLLLDSLRCVKLTKKQSEEIFNYTSDENPTIRHKAVAVLLNSKEKDILERLKKIYDDTPDIILKLTIAKKLLEENIITLNKGDIEYFNSLPKTEVKRKFIDIAEYASPLSLKYLLDFLNDEDPYVQIDSAIKIIQMERK